MNNYKDLNLENTVQKIIESNGYNAKNRELLDKLKKDYSDSTVVNKIVSLLNEKSDKMNEIAKHLSEKLLNKVYDKKGRFSKQTYEKYYNKILKDENNKYFKKLGYSSGLAIEEFRHQITKNTKKLNSKYSEDDSDDDMNNDFIKVFGDDYKKVKNVLHVSNEDKKPTHEIISLYKENSQLHKMIVYQSYAYLDMAREALHAPYDRFHNDVFSAITPILAALYLPKFNLLEYYSIHTNIGRYIDNKYHNHDKEVQADNHLFRSIIDDPHLPVCKSKTIMEDMKNRYLL
jgi:hypothetical protein